MSGNSVADLEALREELVRANAAIQKARMSPGDRKRAYRSFCGLAFRALDTALELLRDREREPTADQEVII